MVTFMGKRNRFEITARILSLCKEPQIKTGIMYGTNLSWRMLLKYLSLLQSIGLLEVHHSPTKYLTTQKGLEFLKKWKELTKLL
jgi:predicted transcriptional regulator